MLLNHFLVAVFCYFFGIKKVGRRVLRWCYLPLFCVIVVVVLATGGRVVLPYITVLSVTVRPVARSVNNGDRTGVALSFAHSHIGCVTTNRVSSVQSTHQLGMRKGTLKEEACNATRVERQGKSDAWAILYTRRVLPFVQSRMTLVEIVYGDLFRKGILLSTKASETGVTTVVRARRSNVARAIITCQP